MLPFPSRWSAVMRGRTAAWVAALIPAVVYGMAILCFLSDRHCLLGFPLDNAWIHRVYSRSLSQGQGLAYNEGSQEAGCTSPFWVMVTAPAHWAEPFGAAKVVLLVKLVGVLLGLWCVRATAILGQRLCGSVWAGCVAASLFAMEPRLAFSALSGMETMLLVALWMGVCLALVRGRFLVALVLLALMPVTRPEAAVVLPLSALAVIGLIHRRGWSVWTVPACCLPLLPVLLWMLFCHSVNGHWLPNTYYLKAKPFHFIPRHLELAWAALSQHGFASLWVYGFGLAACLLPFRSGNRTAAGICLLVLVAAPIAFLLGVVGSRTIYLAGYYWTRYSDPASLTLTAAFCLGYGAIASLLVRPEPVLRSMRAAWRGAVGGRHRAAAPPARQGRLGRGYSRAASPSPSAQSAPRAAEAAAGEAQFISRRQVLAARAIGIAMVGLLVLSLPKLARSFVERSGRLASDSRCIDIMDVAMAEWIRDHTPKAAVVAVSDAGALRYFAQRQIVDITGLNDSAVAFRKTSIEDALATSDWLAIFPRWFNSNPDVLNAIDRRFEPRFTIRIPPQEYTICAGSRQTLMVAFQKTAGPPRRPAGHPRSWQTSDE